jgi:hypothetical protein
VPLGLFPQALKPCPPRETALRAKPRKMPEYTTRMSRESCTHIFPWRVCKFVGVLVCVVCLAQPDNAREVSPQDGGKLRFVRLSEMAQSGASHQKSAAKASLAIPSGTILPVRLNSTISLKCAPGQVITGRIMQDVPLSPGVK